MSQNFDRLRIPVHTVEKGQDIVQKFKELQAHDEFAMYPVSDRNKVIRYVVYAYDPESPFVKNSTSELLKRRQDAADAAGLERNKTTGIHPQSVMDILNLKNDAVNNMIFCYLRMIKNYTWVQITTDEQLFWEHTRLLVKPLEEEDEKKLIDAANLKGKLREERNKIKQDLDKYYKEFYGENIDLQEKLERATPETIGKFIKS